MKRNLDCAQFDKIDNSKFKDEMLLYAIGINNIKIPNSIKNSGFLLANLKKYITM